MTKDELLKALQGEGIDTSNFQEFVKEESSHVHYYKSFEPISRKQFNAVMQALSYFRKYFSEFEFSRLVIRRIIRFMYIHCMVLTSYPSENTFVEEYATPFLKLPENLTVTCSRYGTLTVNRKVVQL